MDHKIIMVDYKKSVLVIFTDALFYFLKFLIKTFKIT